MIPSPPDTLSLDGRTVEGELSRRPAVKIVPPLLLGICLGAAHDVQVPVMVLLGMNLALVLAAAILARRLSPFWIDPILLLILLLTGALAFDGSGRVERDPESPEKSEATALIEVREFGERLGPEMIRVEGFLLYVARGNRFRPFGEMATILIKKMSVIPDPGVVIAANGYLSRPDRSKNPGGISQHEIMEQKGIAWSFRSTRGDWKILENPDRGLPGRSTASRVRAEIGRRIDAIFPPEKAGFLKGILLGARGQIPVERRDRFSRAGVYHILAISGLHVGMIGGIALLLLSILRVPPLPRVAIILTILLAYGILAGMKPSIQRAIVMAVSILFATAISRKIDVVNLLYWLAACFVFLSPRSLWNTGFQMSFLATWGILVLYPALRRPLASLRHRWLNVPGFLLQIALVSICAQAPLLPVMASSFHSFSLISPVANVIVLPVTSVLMPAGLVSMITQPAPPFLSVPFSEVTALLIRVLFSAVDFFSAASLAAIPVPSFGLIGTVSYYTSLFLVSLRLERRLNRETVVLYLLLVGVAYTGFSYADRVHPMRVTYLDVGQGDCTVVEFPTGEIMIMDGGPARPKWDAGRDVIEPYLLDRGFDRVDILSFSHPQLDHVGGLPHLMNRYPVRLLLEPGQTNRLDSYLTILEKSIEKRIPVCWPRRGESFPVGEAELRILHPAPAWITDQPDQDRVNDVSLVIQLIFRNVSFLMTGDIGADVERDLLEQVGRNLEADILKVPHHGSRYSTTIPFLEAVDPRVAVISAGRNNTFGHPSPDVLKALRDRGIDHFRTDIDGGIVIVVDDGGFAVFNGANRLLGRYERRGEHFF